MAKRFPLYAAALLCVSMASPGCEQRPQSRRSGAPGPSSHGRSSEETISSEAISLPSADQRLCTGIVVLIDTSGSMAQVPSGGGQRPKRIVAREALRRIMQYTAQWKQTHPDRMLQLGLYSFSDSPSRLLAMSEFDLEAAESAARRIPKPAGGTAIGEAIKAGFEALYRSGCTRKYLVCVTDGQNTTGATPERVAMQLYRQTGGEVEIHFVAFDTSGSHFAFLDQVNGHVVEAADAQELETRLSEIYEKRILAETMPAER